MLFDRVSGFSGQTAVAYSAGRPNVLAPMALTYFFTNEQHIPDVVFVFVYICDFFIYIHVLMNNMTTMPFRILITCVLVYCCSFGAVKCAKGKAKEVQIIKEVNRRRTAIPDTATHVT